MSKEPKPYQLGVHLFGATSSPSCANFALQRAAQEAASEFPPDVIRSVMEDFYVDDLLRLVRTEDEAHTLVQGVQRVCEMGGFHLTKFVSNNKDVSPVILVDDWTGIVFLEL
jgi:hypothetical protein